MVQFNNDSFFKISLPTSGVIIPGEEIMKSTIEKVREYLLREGSNIPELMLFWLESSKRFFEDTEDEEHQLELVQYHMDGGWTTIDKVIVDPKTDNVLGGDLKDLLVYMEKHPEETRGKMVVAVGTQFNPLGFTYSTCLRQNGWIGLVSNDQTIHSDGVWFIIRR